MPHSLRAKIKSLRYKGVITDKDCDRLCKALDNENVLEQIQAEIYEEYMTIDGGVHDKSALKCMEIIDKYKALTQECVGSTQKHVGNALDERCDDLISKQAVLDGIEELKKSPWATDKRGNGFEYLITESLDIVKDLCIKQTPSVISKPESVTEFADRCRECGARYGKLLNEKSEDQIVEIMAKYIKDNSTPKLIELVIKAIKKVEGKE